MSEPRGESPIDCLLVVERGVCEPDLVKSLLESGYRKYFRDIQARHPQAAALFAADGNRSVLADYGLATQISLTSIVLGTELHLAGLDFEVIDDDNVLELYREVILDRLQRCRMVAISTTYTVHLRTLLRLLELIRSIDRDIPVLIGGQGLSAWRLEHHDPRELYDQLADADVLFFGEAEGSFAELVQRAIDRRPAGDLAGAVDLRSAVPAGKGDVVEVDLDSVAIPDWQILRHYPFNDGAIERFGWPRVASLEEGRGCSFSCRFCSYPLYAGFRRKSPERVVAELRAAQLAGFSTAAFSGAEFLNPIAKSQPVFEAVAAARLQMEIWAYARLDLVSYRPIFADLMERANFRYIQFGMESGDRRVLRAMGKNYDPTKMARGAAMLRQRGIEVYASLIVGYPEETEETIATTLDVLAECNFEHVILHALNVIPGSPLWHRRAEYDLEVSPMGFWAHRTMSLREVPGIVRHMVSELDRRSDSLLNNITQSFSNRFLHGSPPVDRLMAVSRSLQDIIAGEWRSAAGNDTAARDHLWRALAAKIDRVPDDLGSVTVPPSRAAVNPLPLHPQSA